MRFAVLTILPFAFLPCLGCGGETNAQHVATTLPVHGKVTYKGKPVTQGSIKFEPEDLGREAHASIQTDGTFVLTTFHEGDGAVPGVHRIAVTGVNKPKLPPKFRSPSSSQVTIEVSEGQNEYAIDLK